MAILIPSLKYQDLQGLGDVKPADIKVVSVQDALAATQVPGSMREQMTGSYVESKQQNQARIDTLSRQPEIPEPVARSWSITEPAAAR